MLKAMEELKLIHPFLSEADLFKLALGNYIKQAIPSKKANKIDLATLHQKVRAITKDKFKNTTFSQAEIDEYSAI